MRPMVVTQVEMLGVLGTYATFMRMTKSESRVDWRIYMLVIESDLSECDREVKRGKRRSMWIAIYLLCQEFGISNRDESKAEAKY